MATPLAKPNKPWPWEGETWDGYERGDMGWPPLRNPEWWDIGNWEILNTPLVGRGAVGVVPSTHTGNWINSISALVIDCSIVNSSLLLFGLHSKVILWNSCLRPRTSKWDPCINTRINRGRYKHRKGPTDQQDELEICSQTILPLIIITESISVVCSVLFNII